MDVLAQTGQARLERPAGPLAGIPVGVGDDAPQTLQPVAHLREPVAQTTHLAQLRPQDAVGAGGVPAAGVFRVEGVDRQAVQPRNGSCKPIKWYNLLNTLVFPTKISNAEQFDDGSAISIAYARTAVSRFLVAR